MKKKLASLATVAVLTTGFSATVSANTYTVQKGDTLSGIAKKKNTSVAELKQINSLQSDLILINQQLKISQTANVPGQSVQPPVLQTAKTYTIVKGDTMIKIANQHGISLAELSSWNNLKDHLIYPDQKLLVSSPLNTGPAVVSTPPQVSAPPVQAEPANVTEYVIKPGDTLGHIGRSFGVSVQQLKTWNSLSSDLIYVGQKLKITATAAAPVVAPNLPPVVVQPSNPVSEVSGLLNTAKSLLGTPYQWAGSAPGGFDCSGFIFYVFKQSGKQIARLSSEGYYSRSYYVNEPQPGDLVFFENTYKAGISHMGIYLGNNEFIHANSSQGVSISNLNNSYYQSHFDGFKRFY
ncbi:C40 family peptidase [Bacillus sp. V33-4]|uniref:C40 family peptidase n=1 Tax=Bacillus sp. V33-4 TaxID=2054169 RepID=UPI000C78E29F|nr:peptidoglycan endopeptidase [Bacillus sp. V33-4]PLR85430.1 peptidoglycan endopeptidase [Bacillus sp. V33-4]